jgi:sigma-B regulation protein RsbU (phosphoserine phosphatase)
MLGIVDDFVREQLQTRRRRLAQAVVEPDQGSRLRYLLEEVDAALARMDDGSYGICESCHDPIEADRLIADPLLRFCLDHLTGPQRTALEQDLQLAARIQRGLLPSQDSVYGGWHVSYHYEPAGLVSGDYCDVVDAGGGDLYFMLGDVSGKGVAASMLMAHLHAMFRTLVSIGLPLKDMVERASRVFCESTLPTHYATLVCGRASRTGGVEVCNAGHLSPLIVRDGAVLAVEATGLPVGMFSNEEFAVSQVSLEHGQSMVLYTDGVSEATDVRGAEYGDERLRKMVGDKYSLTPSALIAACCEDLNTFRRGADTNDDITILVLRLAEA